MASRREFDRASGCPDRRASTLSVERRTMSHSSGTPSHFKLLAMLRSVRVPSGSPTELMRLRGPATGWLSPFRRGVVAQNATPIAGAGRIAGIPIRSRGFIAGNRDQKLLAHLGES